jgi:nicotinamidase-related amidase
MNCDQADTAVVFIDPQNDVLSPTGKDWGAVGASVTENKTFGNMLRIFSAAKAAKFNVFISPHYFFPTDRTWKFNGPLETDEFLTGTFARRGALSLVEFNGSGADWLEAFKPFIDDGSAQDLWPADKRSRTPTAQTPHEQHRARWHARQYVRRSPFARPDRAGI